MNLLIDLNTVQGYRDFLAVKALPVYSFTGRMATFPDEYADRLGLKYKAKRSGAYKPALHCFDYQSAVSSIAIAKQKYALFMACGLGKTIIYFEFIRHVNRVLPKNKAILIVCPLMVVEQIIDEAKRFYGDELTIEQVSASELPFWTHKGGRIGITNFEALTDSVTQGRLGCIVADESSTMKSAYGKWGTRLIELGRGLDWKLAGTGTPAPNDRIEFANHAVFLDHFPNTNAFLAKYFINRGETSNRWELKAHALKAFYRDLSHWSIFLTNPAVYGWKDNVGTMPPIHVHIEDVELTDNQIVEACKASNDLFGSVGGIASRGRLARIAKGGDSLKPGWIRDKVASFGNESSIIWCKYNPEQDALAKLMPQAGNIDGATPHHERRRIVDAFLRGDIKTIISKPKIMGFGLNLQIASRHIFSTLQDSYEEYTQAIKRSNRIGSTVPLNVHIPITSIERPMVETVLRKAHRVQLDESEQEILFREMTKGNV